MQDDRGFTNAGEVGRGLMGRLFDEPPQPFSIDRLMRERPELRKVLTYGELVIAREIERHIGIARAIRIKELAAMLGENWNDRAVKDVVDRLRSLAHMPIGSTKAPPYGLFLPATAEEAREIHDRLFGEGIRLIRHSQLFGRDKDLVRELEGQLALKAEGHL